MKIGTITTPNAKGQIVIPKEMRNALGINQGIPLNLVAWGQGIYLYPVKGILTDLDFASENSYHKILERTRGAWAGDDWEKTRKRRRKIELAANRKMKKAW